MTASLLLSLFLGAGVTPVNQPLNLVAAQVGTEVRFAVEGESATACEVSYELQIESGANRNRNQSVQRGRAQLLPGQKIVVARATVRTMPSSEWNARLEVLSCDGNRYELHRSGDG